MMENHAVSRLRPLYTKAWRNTPSAPVVYVANPRVTWRLTERYSYRFQLGTALMNTLRFSLE